ncbi:MAG: YdcF family protein [Hyphomonadaceae bacterium]
MSWLKGALLALMTALVIAFAVGFLAFVSAVRSADPPDPLPEADAVVALTGGSQERLETGVRLLREGHARRLLISGVNREVRDQELFDLLNVEPRFAECCIDLGRAAEDTLGNASETAAWARRNGFTRLILVTDDYHMPRSYAELELALPEADLIAYPVPTRFTRGDAWRRDMSIAARLGGEYVKYLMIRVREALIGAANKADDAAKEDEKTGGAGAA